MSVLPAELSTGMVHGRFIVAVIDGDDADLEPEVIPATGRIVFKASVGYIPVPATNEGPVTVMKGPITGVLDGEGYLSTPHPTTGEPMYRGVKLLATDDPDMAVTDWTWAADYRFESVNGVTLQIPAHSFALPGGTVVDLTTMVKVPSSPGYGLPQAEAAALRAEAAAQVALDVKAMADAGEFDGAQGPAGNATMRIDTSVGRRVFVSNGTTEEMVTGYTGWRDITLQMRSGVTATSVHLSRNMNVITMNFRGLVIDGGIVEIYTLPQGFTADSPSVRSGVLASGANLARVVSPSIGIVRLLSGPSGVYDGSVSFTTISAWPTTLPGTPA